MKNLFKNLFIILGLSLLMAFTNYTRPKKSPINTILSAPVVKIDTKIKLEEIKIKGHTAFLTALGHRESGNRYHVVNRFGYMGKYQFGKSTLKTLKIKVTKEEFLNNPDSVINIPFITCPSNLSIYFLRRFLLYISNFFIASSCKSGLFKNSSLVTLIFNVFNVDLPN